MPVLDYLISLKLHWDCKYPADLFGKITVELINNKQYYRRYTTIQQVLKAMTDRLCEDKQHGKNK